MIDWSECHVYLLYIRGESVAIDTHTDASRVIVVKLQIIFKLCWVGFIILLLCMCLCLCVCVSNWGVQLHHYIWP